MVTRRSPRPSCFPFTDRPRLWGTAVSHYQVEGGDRCDWTEWESSGRTEGGPCGEACGSWDRYESDAELAAQAGANAFRFSISWSRVEPRSGEFDDAALERYRRLATHLVARGLEPCVTLFHYTHPVWFHSESPWHSSSSVGRFARFARRVVEALGDSVRMYVPINEPLVFVLAAYVETMIPPGVGDPKLAPYALHNLLAAHAAAAAVIRELRPEAAVGIAHNMIGFAPSRPGSILDRLVSRIAHRSYNRGLVEAFGTDRWDFLLPPLVRCRGRVDGLASGTDFFGVNFYSRIHVRTPGRDRFIGDFKYRDPAGRGFTDNGWEVFPEQLTGLLREAAESGLPLVLTENGIADASDTRRASFLEEHYRFMRAVERDGIPVHGYFHWSIIDNFEWLDGYSPRFGLYAVDRDTLIRFPRSSVDTFRRLGADFLRP